MRLITLCLAIVLLGSAAQGQDQRLVRLATGSLEGAYFPVGVAICRLVNQTRRTHGIRCSAVPTDGSVANIGLLRSGEVDLAIVQSDVQAAAWSGAIDAPYEDLRALFSLHAEPLTIVARQDADMETIRDLEGGRISYGNPGSGHRALWDSVAAGMGWNENSFAEAYELAPADQARELCDDRIDAFVMAVGHPALTVQEATLTCDAVLLRADGPEIDALVESSGSYFPTRIAGGLYRNSPDDVPTFGVGATLVSRADVPAEVVAVIAGAVFSGLDDLRGFEPVLADLNVSGMLGNGLTAPLHEGAEQVFVDRGIRD